MSSGYAEILFKLLEKFLAVHDVREDLTDFELT